MACNHNWEQSKRVSVTQQLWNSIWNGKQMISKQRSTWKSELYMVIQPIRVHASRGRCYSSLVSNMKRCKNPFLCLAKRVERFNGWARKVWLGLDQLRSCSREDWNGVRVEFGVNGTLGEVWLSFLWIL